MSDKDLDKEVVVEDECCPFWLKLYKSNWFSCASSTFDSDEDLVVRYETIDDGSEQI